MAKKPDDDSLHLAGRHYQKEDEQRNDFLSKGLSTTHEQVSDAYTEGEIGAVIEDAEGKSRKIPRKDYD
jgi:hypothetical protein